MGFLGKVLELNLLHGSVQKQTEALVVLCISEVRRRPWCGGEMMTARLRIFDTVLFLDIQVPYANTSQFYECLD